LNGSGQNYAICSSNVCLTGAGTSRGDPVKTFEAISSYLKTNRIDSSRLPKPIVVGDGKSTVLIYECEKKIGEHTIRADLEVVLNEESVFLNNAWVVE